MTDLKHKGHNARLHNTDSSYSKAFKALPKTLPCMHRRFTSNTTVLLSKGAAMLPTSSTRFPPLLGRHFALAAPILLPTSRRNPTCMYACLRPIFRLRAQDCSTAVWRPGHVSPWKTGNEDMSHSSCTWLFFWKFCPTPTPHDITCAFPPQPSTISARGRKGSAHLKIFVPRRESGESDEALQPPFSFRPYHVSEDRIVCVQPAKKKMHYESLQATGCQRRTKPIGFPLAIICYGDLSLPVCDVF